MLRYRVKRTAYCICAVLCIILSVISCRKQSNGEKEELQEIVFAAANTTWWTAPTIVATTNDLFSKQKLKVRTFDVMTGLASKNAVISGAADVGLVAATPLAMGAYKEEPVQILGCYAQSDSLIAIVTRKQQNINTSDECDAVQEKVAIVPGTISEWYLYSFLKDANQCDPNNLKNMENGKLSTVHLRPQDIPNVMKKGDAESAVIWEPFVTMIEPNPDDPNAKYNVLRKPGIYTLSLYLITRPDVIEKKPKEIEAFVKAVSQACSTVEDSNEMIQRKMEDKFEYEHGSLNKLWKLVVFSFRQNPDEIEREIRNDIEIAKALGRTPDSSDPNVGYMFEYMRSSKQTVKEN